MTAARKFRGFPQAETCSEKRTLRECTTSGSVDDIVLIDVDSDDFPNIIIVDLPESLEQKLREKAASNVIRIDDDAEEIIDGIRSDTDANTSNRDFAAFVSPDSVDLDDQDCLFVGEEKSHVNHSKCEQTYSGKAGSRNRYGLGPESDTSESDCSDCEVIEGTSERYREEWERASKNKVSARKGQSGVENQSGSSDFEPVSQHDVRERVNKRSENLNRSSSKCAADDNKGFYMNQGTGDPVADFHQELDEQTPLPEGQSDSEGIETVFAENDLFTDVGIPPNNTFCSGFFPFCDKERGGEERTMPCNLEKDDEFNVGHDRMAEPCLYNYQPDFDEHFDPSVADDEDAFFFACKHPGNMQADHDQVASQRGDEEFLSTSRTHLANDQPNLEDQVNLTAEISSLQNNESCNKAAKLVGSKEKISQNEVSNAEYEESFCIPESHETDSVFVLHSPMEVEEPALNRATENQHFDEKSDAKPCAATCQDNVITDRQKIKETDDYRHAMEEEWASRRRQLQIQAEEAQRMRRRRKAENTRLMDMERRQKQRLEEVRETQKKDKENMDLKENIRAEVQTELSKLEMKCTDMASLLRGLGIHVDGGFYPLSHDVQAAYKRALLKFHPDRASRTDLRRQVEAEETFKLISRMKETLMS